MLSKKNKELIIDDLVKKVKEKKVAVFSDFTGLSVAQISKLRRELRKQNAVYKVIKKTLLRIVLEKAGFDPKLLLQNFKGSCAVAIGFDSEIEAPKIITKFAKARENEKMKILGGLLDQSVLSKEQIVAIAFIPSKEVLLGQLAYVLASPITNLMGVLNGNTKKLIYALQQIQQKKSA